MSRAIEIRTDYIRLDELLKLAGVTGTGGQAKRLIQEGRILVNNEVCQMRGKKLRPGDQVRVAEEEITLVYHMENV